MPRELLLDLDVGRHLVQGDVPGAFHHGLDPGPSGPFHELPDGEELCDLGPVGAVGEGAWAEAVPQGEGHVVGAGDVQKVVKAGVEGVFLAAVEHPGGHEPPAPAHDARGAGAIPVDLEVLEGHPHVHGDVVHPLLAVLLNHLEELVRRHVKEVLAPGRPKLRLVDGHGAQGDGGHLQDPLADRLEVSPGGEVHNGVRPVLDGHPGLLHLLLHVHVVVGGAQVGVHLDGKPLPDPLEVGEGLVVRVPGDDDPARRHPFPHELGGNPFLLGHVGHLLGDLPFPCRLKLRHPPPPKALKASLPSKGRGGRRSSRAPPPRTRLPPPRPRRAPPRA